MKQWIVATLLLGWSHPRHIAVIVDLSRSSPPNACQRDLKTVAYAVASLRTAYPSSTITIYASAAPPSHKNQPIHAQMLHSLNALTFQERVRLRMSAKSRHKFMITEAQKIFLKLRPVWDSLLTICPDCSALQYTIWEVFTLKELVKPDVIVLLSDGLDTFPWKQVVSVPILIVGTAAKETLESRIQQLWRGWKVRFLRRDCEPSSLVELVGNVLQGGE